PESRLLLGQPQLRFGDRPIPLEPVNHGPIPGRPRQAVGIAGAAERQRIRLKQISDGRPLLRRPQSFFSIRSFSALCSSTRSAYIRFSFAFSASSSRLRLSSDTLNPPNFDFHW